MVPCIESYQVYVGDPAGEPVETARSFAGACAWARACFPTNGLVIVEHIAGNQPYYFRRWYFHCVEDVDSARFDSPAEEWTE